MWMPWDGTVTGIGNGKLVSCVCDRRYSMDYIAGDDVRLDNGSWRPTVWICSLPWMEWEMMEKFWAENQYAMNSIFNGYSGKSVFISFSVFP